MFIFAFPRFAFPSATEGKFMGKPDVMPLRYHYFIERRDD